MKLSVINDSRVTDNKGGYLGQIDGTGEYDTINDFVSCSLQYHICNAVLLDGRRNTAAFQEIWCLQYDFDNGVITSKSIHQQLRQSAHVILGSKNHLKDKQDGKGIIERFHLFIFLDKPIKDAGLYKFIVKRMAKEYKWSSDRACCDVTRYFYRHSSLLYCNQAKPMNIDYYMRLREVEELEKWRIENRVKVKIATIKKSNIHYKERTPIEAFKRSKGFTMLKDLSSGGSGRYYTRCSIAGIMKTCGVDRYDADKLFREYGAYGGKFDEKTLDKLYN